MIGDIPHLNSLSVFTDAILSNCAIIYKIVWRDFCQQYNSTNCYFEDMVDFSCASDLHV